MSARATARAVAVALGAAVLLSCGPLAQPAGPTRTPVPTFRPLAGSEAFKLVELSVGATYAVAYAASGSIDGTAVMGTLTTYQRPPNVRLDATIIEDGEPVSFRSYVTPDGSVVCHIAEGVAQCQRTDEPFGPNTSASNILAQRPDHYTVIERERLTIADEEAQCFMFRPRPEAQADFDEAFICYAGDGVPLMVEMKLGGGDSFILEGRIAKRDVSDEEMRVPTP